MRKDKASPFAAFNLSASIPPPQGYKAQVTLNFSTILKSRQRLSNYRGVADKLQKSIQLSGIFAFCQ